MARLEWDQPLQRVFQDGLSKAVLYKTGGGGVPWSGFVSVEESPSVEHQSFYYDGRKYAGVTTEIEFEGTLKALHYPPEFDRYQGLVETEVNGVTLTAQGFPRFGLSYQTKFEAPMVEGIQGYLIHILYNLVATPRPTARETIAEDRTPLEFEWDISSTPVLVPGFAPTGHVIVNSLTTEPSVLEFVESLLYGDETRNAALPSLPDLLAYLSSAATILIIDNGDGTWTAMGNDSYVYYVGDDEFEIDGATVTVYDDETYDISTTLL